MQKPNRAAYTAAEFLDWSASKALVLSPKFQRRGVWQPAARSFLIDTLLRSMPVPPVYLRITQSALKDKVVREVIDGQQRIASVLSFMRDEFALSSAVGSDWKGKTFTELQPAEQAAVRDYAFSAEVFSSLSDAEVLEIFSRLNTYSVKLNDQELRNGKYFGAFKQTVYQLALEHLEFWRLHKIFTERSIARMEEAELVSELLVASLSGLQDKKKSIDSFYAKYDESFPGRDEVVTRFKAVLSEITALTPTPLVEIEFNRRPLFYTLYTVVFHRMFGLPNEKFPTPKTGKLSNKDKDRLAATMVSLSEALTSFGDANSAALDENTTTFLKASLRQTDNLIPRRARLASIYSQSF